MATEPFSRQFPQELVDNIIDHAHDDKPTLASCTLVCRSWLPSSSYHLLDRLHVNLGKHATFVSTTMPPGHDLVLRDTGVTIESFLATLRATPRLRNAKSLSLMGPDPSPRMRHAPQDATSQEVVLELDALQSLLEILPSLSSLFIATESIRGPLSPTSPVQGHARKFKLKTLGLSSTGRVGDALALLDMFDEIGELHMRNFQFQDFDRLAIPPTSAPLKVKHLDLTEGSPSSVTQSLLVFGASLDKSTFESLSVCELRDAEGFTALFMFLAAFGENIKSLDYRGSLLGYPNAALMLQPLVNLESIRLSTSLHIEVNRTVQLDLWNFCMDVLDQVPATIKNIHVYVEVRLMRRGNLNAFLTIPITPTNTSPLSTETIKELFSRLDWTVVERTIARSPKLANCEIELSREVVREVTGYEREVEEAVHAVVSPEARNVLHFSSDGAVFISIQRTPY